VNIGSHSWKEHIRRSAASLGIETAPEHLEAFSIHARELAFWNRRTNLTTITDPQQVATRHFVDSMAPIRFVPAGAAVLDIGSGAGFPGIPIKVLRSDLTVTLIDSVRKKVSFQNHVIRTLGLDRIEAVHMRAEQMAKPTAADNEKRGRTYDVIVSRAVGSPEILTPLALPLLSENGILIAMVGKAASGAFVASDRFRALERIHVFDYRLPGAEAERSIWCFRPDPRSARTRTEEGS
jgi:16S rRNA (guanine527-N7)-methyltransferase